MSSHFKCLEIGYTYSTGQEEQGIGRTGQAEQDRPDFGQAEQNWQNKTD